MSDANVVPSSPRGSDDRPVAIGPNAMRVAGVRQSVLIRRAPHNFSLWAITERAREQRPAPQEREGKKHIGERKEKHGEN